MMAIGEWNEFWKRRIIIMISRFGGCVAEGIRQDHGGRHAD